MEIKNEVIDDVKPLTQDERDLLAKKLADDFRIWDNDRNSQIVTARNIMAETYLNQPKRKFNKDLAWKSDVKLNAIYNIKRAKKSLIWREMWSNPDQMFDVRGTDELTEQLAPVQKAAIVDSLEKMDIGKQYDDAVDNLFDIGEMIFKTDWEQRRKIVKRQNKTFGWVFQNIVKNATGAGFLPTEFKSIEIPYYENARVESISPFMFVFDHSKYKLKDKASWDGCIKIYKRFETLDGIKSNPLYMLTSEQWQDLEHLSKSKKVENKELVDLRDKNIFGNQYSILYAHGDFKIGGKVYKNYIAEVLVGKYLIRFEENPMYINPFILCALEYDPITKRGISPLKSAYSMCKKEEELTNTAFDVQKLIANPPCWANEDLLDDSNTERDGSIKLAPGKFIKIKNDYAGGMPKEVSFSAGAIKELLDILGKKITDISSISSVMYGNIEDSKRTATELNLADRGAGSQVSKELDTINQDLTIPMIKNVSELLAMFKDGDDYIYLREKGRSVLYVVTNQIRQAQYSYIYEDRNAIYDRKSKFSELYNLFKSAGQKDELFMMFNWKEIYTTAMEMIGFDNTEKFFR